MFRHVCDLATAQAAKGHLVGIVADSHTGGEAADAALRRLQDVCRLGIFRLPMSRQIGASDYRAYRKIQTIAIDQAQADILHGHGAKGGAYARLVAQKLRRQGHRILAFYTPHGGSLHYDAASLRGWLYLGLERRLAPMTDGLIFESAFSERIFTAKIYQPPCETRVIPNGLRPEEFYQVIVEPDAADFLFVGELRQIKGVDLFLEALRRLKRSKVRALIVGSGPDERAYKRLTQKAGLSETVRFHPPMPARTAFARARCLVVPSRAESLPYIVLEAAAAHMPQIATRVGGIPEIVAGTEIPLIEPDNISALQQQMTDFLQQPQLFAERAGTLRRVVSERYTVEAMAQSVLDFYGERMHALQAE